MKRSFFLTNFFALLFSSACDRNDSIGVPAFFSEGAGRREIRSVAYDTLWTYGGFQDTLMVAPNVLLAKPDGIYTLDVSTQKVVKLTHEGNVAWVWGRRGQGPGELGRARAMAKTANGVVVADNGNLQLLCIDSLGFLEREVKINIDPETYLGSIEGIVTLPSGYVLETTSALLPFFRETGDQYTSAEPPWPRMAEMSYLQRSGVINGIGSNKWIFSFMFGNGWIVFEDNRAAAALFICRAFGISAHRCATQTRRSCAHYIHTVRKPTSDDYF